MFQVFHVSLPVQICIVLFCFIIHFAFFHVRISTIVYINAQWCQREVISDWNLKCPILTADCCEFIEMSYSDFFSSKLKFVRIGTFPWDSLVSAEQHFLTVDIKQEIFSLSQSCICLHVSVCVVPQGRTPQGLGGGDHRWAAGALTTAQMMVSYTPGFCPAGTGRVLVLLKVLTEILMILEWYKASKNS